MPCTIGPTRRVAALAAPALLSFAVYAAVPIARAQNPSAGSLRRTLAQQRQREASLSQSSARLGALIDRLGAEAAILAQRQARAQVDLDRALSQLSATRGELRAARAHLVVLRAHLRRGRHALARELLAQYVSPQPDVVDVILNAHSFAQLLDRAEFLRRVAHANAEVLDAVRLARDATRHQATTLSRLEGRQQAGAVAVRQERNALVVMRAALGSRQASLAQARAARVAALTRTMSDRRRAEQQLSRLQAQRALTTTTTSGPGGPWAIPWSVVQCESGGQDLPPNGATASGYYQITDATWRGLGGSTPHAYQAPKSEQDRLAAALWAGGAGASNWVCAPLAGH